MRKGYRATEATTLTRRGARRSAARAALRRLREASDALDDSAVGDVLGAVALLVTMISGLWLAYGVFGCGRGRGAGGGGRNRDHGDEWQWRRG